MISRKGIFLAYNFCVSAQAKDNGLENSVMTVEEIRTGIESRGTGKSFLPFYGTLVLNTEF